MDQTAITILNRYTLTGPAEAFRDAITALAERVEREGHPGLTAYRFYLDEGTGTARAVIDYTGPEAWQGHHDIAMGWPEMGALHAVARLDEITFLGPVPPEITAWLDASPLTATVTTGFAPAAGFRR